MKRVMFGLLCLVICGILFLSQAYRIKPRQSISPQLIATLDSLAKLALSEKEVPIGAILMYGDSILAMGYNTIVRDTLLSGHAELNALNEAHRKFRLVWGQLDRSKMTMYSTYEPCEMCKGAMLNMHISHVLFEGPKPAWDQVKNTAKSWGYDWQKQRFYAPGMQETLFQQHPDYHPQ